MEVPNKIHQQPITKLLYTNLKPGLTHASMTTHFSFVLMQNPEVLLEESRTYWALAH